MKRIFIKQGKEPETIYDLKKSLKENCFWKIPDKLKKSQIISFLKTNYKFFLKGDIYKTSEKFLYRNRKIKIFFEVKRKNNFFSINSSVRKIEIIGIEIKGVLFQ